jgi:hypothetical protein
MSGQIQQRNSYFLAVATAFLAVLVISAPGISIALSLYVPVPIENLNAGLRIVQISFSAIILMALFFSRNYVYRYRLNYIFLLFYILYIISCIRHELIHGFVELDPLRFWFVVGPLVISSLILALSFDKTEKYNVSILMAYIFFISAALMVFYMITNGIDNIRNYTVYTDEIGGSLVFGYFSCYGLALAFGIIFSEDMGRVNKTIFIIGVPLLLYILLLSYSRGSVVSCVAAFLYVLFCRFVRRGGAANYTYFALGAIFFLAVATWYVGSDWGSRVTGTSDRISSGGEGRIDIWIAIFNLSKDSVFGWGVEVPYLNHPHNIFVEIFMNMGIFGVILFLVLLFICISNILRSKFLLDNLWIGSIFSAAFVGSLFSSTLYLNVVVWFAIAIVTRVDRFSNQRRASPARNPAFQR